MVEETNIVFLDKILLVLLLLLLMSHRKKTLFFHNGMQHSMCTFRLRADGNCETTDTEIVVNRVKQLHVNFVDLHILVVSRDEYKWIVVGIPMTVYKLLKEVIDTECNITVHITRRNNEFHITNTYTEEVQQKFTVSCTYV